MGRRRQNEDATTVVPGREGKHSVERGRTREPAEPERCLPRPTPSHHPPSHALLCLQRLADKRRQRRRRPSVESEKIRVR
jgi:hypothetical protein